MLATESEVEMRHKWRALTTVYPPTGEIVGETEWRRWWTEDGWHPLTPQAIREEYGWLFEYEPYGGARDA